MSQLPYISGGETQEAIRQARHWKSVHRITEQMYGTARKLPDAFRRYRRQKDASSLERVREALDIAHTDSRRLYAALDQLPAAVKENGVVEFLLRTRICFPALMSQLASPVFEEEEIRQASQLCQRLCQWFYDGLVAADSMLEAYFRTLEPVP